MIEHTPADDPDLELPQSEQIRRARKDRASDRRKESKHREKQGNLDTRTASGTPPGRVVRSEGAYFVVQMDDGEEIRAKTVKRTQSANENATLVAVGDLVIVERPENSDAVITETLARRSKLSRRAAGRRDEFEQVVVSNVDLLVIVSTITDPPYRAGIIDRYTVAAHEGNLDVVVAFNKIDLLKQGANDPVLLGRMALYQSLGYESVAVSSTTKEGMEALREVLTGYTSVFAGHSGVGKSSIINALLDAEVGKTGTLSKKYNRGAHTTSSSVLMPLDDEGSFIVDTPGVREFANFDIDPDNLKFAFVEFLDLQQECAITNCSHLHEPGCAIIEAVEQDEIDVERYSSYAKLYEEAKASGKARLENR